MNEDLKSNPSYSQMSAEKKEVKQVVKHPAREKKKTLGDKIAETFLAADIESVTDHIIFNVIVPAIKDMFVDSINGMVNMMAYGDRRGDPKRKRGDNEEVSYTSYYKQKRREEARSSANANGGIIRTFEFNTVEEAHKVYDEAKQILIETDVVSVKDIYNLSCIKSDYPTNGLGWTTLSGFEVSRGPHGVGYLRVPRPVRID